MWGCRSSHSSQRYCTVRSQAPVWLGKTAVFPDFPNSKSPKKSDFPEGEFQNFEWKYDILYWKMSNFCVDYYNFTLYFIDYRCITHSKNHDPHNRTNNYWIKRYMSQASSSSAASTPTNRTPNSKYTVTEGHEKKALRWMHGLLCEVYDLNVGTHVLRVSGVKSLTLVCLL